MRQVGNYRVNLFQLVLNDRQSARVQSSSPTPATSAISAATSSPLALACPIALDLELRRLCSSCVRTCICLRSLSRDSSLAVSSAKPRVLRRRSARSAGVGEAGPDLASEYVRQWDSARLSPVPPSAAINSLRLCQNYGDSSGEPYARAPSCVRSPYRSASARHTLKIAGIAFAVGLLLFLLVWATGRKDNFYKPSSAQPTAGAPADDTIAPLPAPAGPGRWQRHAAGQTAGRHPDPGGCRATHPPAPPLPEDAAPGAPGSAAPSKAPVAGGDRPVPIEGQMRPPATRRPHCVAAMPATWWCGGRGRYRQSRRRHTGAAQRLARSGPRGHGSGPALALPSCATQWSAGGRQHGHPIRVQTCAVSAAKPSCTAARASTRGRPSQVSPASANAA